MDGGTMNLPPGFELEQASSGNPGNSGVSLPPGFELESQGQDSYWGDVGKNAKEGLGEIPGGALKAADMFSKAASISSPVEIGKSIFQAVRGTPPSQTSIGQDVQAVPEMARGAAAGLWQTTKDVGNAAIMPAQMAFGTPASQTNFGQTFRQRPLSSVANVASVAIPAGRAFLRGSLPAAAGEAAAAGEEMAGGAAQDLPVMQPGMKTGDPHALFAYNDKFGPGGTERSIYNIFGDPAHPSVTKGGGFGSSVTKADLDRAGIPIKGREPRSVGRWEPLDKPDAPPPPGEAPMTQATPMNFLERFGTKGVNSQAGITPETVQAMTRAGMNPADIGGSIGKRLVDEKILGQSPAETFNNAARVKNQYGQSVEDALNAIRQKANEASDTVMGIYSPANDPLRMESLKVLKPLLDEKVRLANSVFSANRRMARPWTEAYDNLANESNANGGFTTLDHINTTMQEVGEMLGKLEKGTAPYKNVARLYGNLANVRDGMIDAIVQSVNDPSLKSNLLKANQGYTFYSRIMPDLGWQAAAESVGGPETTIVGTLKSEAKPFLSRTAVKAGSLWRRQ